MTSTRLTTLPKPRSDEDANPSEPPMSSAANRYPLLKGVLLASLLSFVLCLAFLQCFRYLELQSISRISDEVAHIRITQEMWQGGKWWQPTITGVPYYNKPPLKMWLTFLPISLFGESNLSYRLIDAGAGFLVVLLTAFFAYRVLGSALTGILAAFILSGCPPYIVGRHGVRHATQDSFLVLLCVLAMFAAWELFGFHMARKRADISSGAAAPPLRWAVIFGLCTGCAVLTKSAAGFLPLAVCGVLFLIYGSFRDLWRYAAALGVIVVLCFSIPAAYYVPHCLITEGACYEFFVEEVIGRGVEGIHNVGDTTYYFRALFGHQVLGSALLIGLSLLLALVRAVWLRDHRMAFLLAWGALPVLLYSGVQSRLLWYILPAAPALSLLMAFCLVEAGRLTISWIYEKPLSGIFGSSVRAAAVIACLALAVHSLYQVGSKHIAVWNKVSLAPEKQLRIDRAVQDIRWKAAIDPSTVFIAAENTIPQFIDTRRGWFNREAIYLNMAARRTSFVPADQAALSENYDFLLTPLTPDTRHLLFEESTLSYQILPPHRYRKQAALFISKHDNLPYRGFVPKKKIIDFGNNDLSFLYGLSKPEDTGAVDVRFGVGSRAALQLQGDWALRTFGSSHKLNAGYSGRHSKKPLLLSVYVNETLASTISLKRNRLDTYEFHVPPGVWESESNVIKLAVKFEDGTVPGTRNRYVMYNWLTIFPTKPDQTEE